MGKSSGGIRKAGKNIRKNKVDSSESEDLSKKFKQIDELKKEYDSGLIKSQDITVQLRLELYLRTLNNYNKLSKKDKANYILTIRKNVDNYGKSELLKETDNYIVGKYFLEKLKINSRKVSSEKIKKPFENTPKEGKFQFENIGGIIYRRDNKTGIVSKQGKAPKFKLP